MHRAPTAPTPDELSASLVESEHRFRRLFERAPAPMWVFDTDSLRILAVNDAAVERYGYTHDEFLALTLRDLRPSSELAAFWRAFAALRAGHDIRGFFRHRDRRGGIFDVEITTRSLPSAGGNLRLATALDITEQRRAVDAARFLDGANSLLTASLDESIICRNLSAIALPRLGDWCAVYRWHGDAPRLCGFTHVDPLDEALVAQRVRRRRFAADHPLERAFRAERTIALSPGEHHEVVVGHRGAGEHRDPRLRVRAALYVPIRGRGQTLGVLECVAARDGALATEADVALAEELASRAGMALDNALLYQEARRRAVPRTLDQLAAGAPREASGGAHPLHGMSAGTLLESLPHGCFVVDADWRIGYANRHAEAVLRCPREELVGQVLWEIFPGLAESDFGAIYRRARAEHRYASFEGYYPAHDAWYEVTAYPAGADLVLFFRDTSERHEALEERESIDRALRTCLEEASDLVHVLAPDGRVIFANSAWRRTLGYVEEELEGLNALDCVAPEWLDEVRAARRRCLADETVREMEFEVLARDGRRVPVRGSFTARFARGRPVATFGIFQDLSASRAAARELSRFEERVATSRRASGEVLDRVRYEVRTPLASIIGFARLLEGNVGGRLSAQEVDFAARIARGGGELLELLENVLAYAAIEAGSVELRAAPVALDAIVRELVSSNDERARARGVALDADVPPGTAPLATDEGQLRHVVRSVFEEALRDAAPGHLRLSVATRAADGAPEHLEIAYQPLRGEPRGPHDESMPREANALGAPPVDLGLGMAIAHSLCRALGYDLVVRDEHRQGRRLRIVFGHAPARHAPPPPAAAAEHGGALVANLLHTVVNASPLAIVAYDLDLTIRLWNDGAARIFGWTAEEMVGRRHASEFQVDGDDRPLRDLLQRALAAGGLTAVPARRRCRDGRVIEVQCSVAPLRDPGGRLLGFVSLLADVTERARLEAELRQAQKMEVVGRLAGGVAHDFNNLLTVIQASASFLLEELEPAHHGRRDAEEILAAARRATALTRQLLLFARKEVPRVEVLELGALLTGMQTLLRRLIPSSIELAVVTGTEPCHLAADRGQLEQVVMNLALNARDAMPQGGALVIEAECAAPREDAAAAAAPPGGYVCLSVSDTGVGMDERTRAHIFEPFFTTKAAGQGTGLGLATVYGIVTGAGGRVEVESAPGAGTTFRIYLPRVLDEATVARTGEHPVPVVGTETVLLVEDQDAVRTVAARMLRARGYTVLAARHGADALALVEGYAGGIDVLVTDLVMPEMDGRTLAARLREALPRLGVVLLSGYDVDAGAGLPGPAGGEVAVVRKPFSADDLARAVREALVGARGSA